MSDMIEKYNNYRNLSASDKANYAVDQRLMYYLSNDRLEYFLTGEFGDTFKMDDSPTPINYSVVFSALYRNHLKRPDLNINSKFIAAVKKLLQGSPMQVYFGINALRYQTYYEKQNIATFKISDISVYELAKSAIHNNEEQLRHISAFEGQLHEDRMLGYMRDCSEQIENNTGYKIM